MTSAVFGSFLCHVVLVIDLVWRWFRCGKLVRAVSIVMQVSASACHQLYAVNESHHLIENACICMLNHGDYAFNKCLTNLLH